MAKMVSLKMTAKEAKTDLGYPVAQSEGKADLPKYPYDTKMRLSNDTLEKLDVSPADFKVGESFEVTARVEVVGTSISERQGGRGRSELELQITDIALDTKAKKKAKAQDDHLNRIAGAPASDDDSED